MFDNKPESLVFDWIVTWATKLLEWRKTCKKQANFPTPYKKENNSISPISEPLKAS
jgi:hypothetical protein